MAPRGPLPARVYWFRRLVVLGVAVLLVAGLARLLGGSSDASSDEDPQATTAGATTSTTPTDETVPTDTAATEDPAATPTEGSTETPKRKKKQTPTVPPLAEPSGTCENGDIVATPTITEAPGGSDVPITLNLRTRVTEACTWTVSPETLTVTITSGSDFIWSTQECPAAIVPQDVVVRQAVDAPIVVTWEDAKRSDETCSGLTEWAWPGYYHVEAAALAGEPTDVQFELVRPASEVITKTVTPKPQKGKKKQQDSTHQPGEDGAGDSEG
jgi:hypothetical protein